MNKVQFDSIDFQERNGTCGMKPECSGWNLAEKSGTDRDLKWDENYSILWIGMEYFDYFKQNRIKLTTLVVHGLQAYKNYSNFTCQQLLFLPQESNSLKTQYDESKTPLHKELPTIVCLNDPPACQLYHFPPESTTTSAPPHACFSKVYQYSPSN